MQRQQTEREELQEQLKRKYQPQIKEQKAIISQIEYELEQLERQYQQDMLDLEEWKKKANEERNAKNKPIGKRTAQTGCRTGRYKQQAKKPEQRKRQRNWIA